MDDKKYSVIGKVEIGTDEYRDLIEGLAKAEHDYSEANSKRWEESRRADAAEKELKEIRSRYNLMCEFFKQDDGASAKLKLFRIERAEKEQEDA